MFGSHQKTLSGLAFRVDSSEFMCGRRSSINQTLCLSLHSVIFLGEKMLLT